MGVIHSSGIPPDLRQAGRGPQLEQSRVLPSRRRQSTLEQRLYLGKRCALGQSGAGPHAQPFSVVEVRRIRVGRYAIQQRDGLVVSPVLHQDFGFADPEIGTPCFGLHPVADFPTALQSFQTLFHVAGFCRSPAKQPLRVGLPVENMMAIHDLDELFAERENGGGVLLNH